MEFQIDCDSPKMEAVYKLAEEFRVPVLLHFEYGAANMGFERFYRIVANDPGVPFIGHAQTWCRLILVTPRNRCGLNLRAQLHPAE